MIIFQHKIGNVANSSGSRHLAACFLVITCLFSQSVVADTAAVEATASNKPKTKQALPKDAMIALGKDEKPGLKASGDAALSQSATAIADTATVEVTASNSSKYKTKQILPKDAMIELGKGEKLGLKASAGGGTAAEYSVQGPYSDEQAKQRGLPRVIETLIELASPHARRFGLLTNPNHLDLSRTGDFGFCYPAAAASITLWRDDAPPDSGRLSIKKLGSEKSAAQRWPARKNTLAWPRKLPVIDGASYLVELDWSYMVITLHQLPSEELPSNVYKASRMVEKGCFRQAELLLSAGGH
ncbi:MAG: hypothetical protein GY862_23335 [Gammaproteobacteria bacterium]|nr:hypothetical protein [Gammaproteobacteria bacterium]